jgi:hypothetical protein
MAKCGDASPFPGSNATCIKEAGHEGNQHYTAPTSNAEGEPGYEMWTSSAKILNRSREDRAAGKVPSSPHGEPGLTSL